MDAPPPDLKAGLTPGLDQSDFADDMVQDSPLRQALPDSIDELLDRVNDFLIEGVPHKIRANDDKLLKKMVLGYRREADSWIEEEKQKGKAPSSTGRSRKKPVDLSDALVFDS